MFSIAQDVRSIILAGRSAAARSVDFHRVATYWNIGQRVVEDEQDGASRAEYGAYLIRDLAGRIEPEFGSAFSVRQLELARQFYRTYPIANALRSQLNWAQYRLLIRIDDADKREFYELESVRGGWTGRETERQINASLYERLLLSSDKQSVMAVARQQRLPEHPGETIKDSMTLEFLGLKPQAAYYERDLEQALITHQEGT